MQRVPGNLGGALRRKPAPKSAPVARTPPRKVRRGVAEAADMQRSLMLLTSAFLLASIAVPPAPVAATTTRVHRCVNTTVFEVEPRLVTAGQTHFTKGDFASGVEVAFDTTLGVNASTWATVVHYQGDSGNALMMAERRGDPVRLCLVGVPVRDRYCNPATDLRGRVYSVYDYRRRASYSGMNSEHDCGGA